MIKFQIGLIGVEMSESEPVSCPWGTYQIIDSGADFQVKRLTVNPGEALSLQHHDVRHEHWIVAEGQGKATKNYDEFILSVGDVFDVPPRTLHRLENEGPVPLVVIEVQLGEYLGEDDIVRWEDRYGRPTASKDELYKLAAAEIKEKPGITRAQFYDVLEGVTRPVDDE